MEEKIFRDTRTQIGILKSRGVIIGNKHKAKDIIRNCGYYNLVNGYKDIFLQQKRPYEKYLPGTTIEEIYALYDFDRKLRILTLEYILEIEKHIKSIVAYCFSKEHGHKDYLKVENFDSQGQKKQEQVNNLISKLENQIRYNAKEPSVAHYVSEKNYIPLWVLTNAISMGDISKFYANMIQKERNDVARRLKWGVRENELEGCLIFLSSIRNRCAHDERLFSYSSYASLNQNKYFYYFRRSMEKNNYFSVMVSFKMLLTKQRYNAYQERFESLLKELSSRLKTVPISKVRTLMGIPNNWKKLDKL